MLMYSNTGYILLGMVIEAATGKKLGDLYQKRIFDPLGLESALFIEGVPQEGEITTQGYWWTEEGERLNTTSWNASQGWAAGAAAMTAEDLAAYGSALAAGEVFKNPDTLKEMLTFNADALYTIGGPYGLGLIDFAGDGSVWGHEGQTIGFQTLWFTKPEEGIVVVGLSNSASYKAYAFLNVLNIIDGKGALPVSSLTLLPAGDVAATKWRWVQFSNPVEMTEIDETAGLTMIINKDQSVFVKTKECGLAFGDYTTEGTGNINFEIDNSTLTCDADSLAGKLVQYLNDAVSWHFDNGGLIIELPSDGGTMVFTPTQNE